MTRISLDVTPGTFARLETICKFQSKSEYLRELIDVDLHRRSKSS